jgi:ribonucleotide reductase beta subunit family protein with ferritin-like domain
MEDIVKDVEPITVETKSRHVLYPIMYPAIFQMFKTAQASYWVTDEINFQQDLADLEKLSADEKSFIRQILAFFAASDGIVYERRRDSRSQGVLCIPKCDGSRP